MQNHATPCKIKQNHVMPKSSKCHAKNRNKIFLRSVYTYIDIRTRGTAQNRAKKAILRPLRARIPGENARPSKKNWTRKKRMASWARQRQQITEAADGGARACTGADGAVVQTCGADRAALAADRRAGQHYYSHLGLRPPSKDFDNNHPLSERAQRLPCCGAEEACAPCRARYNKYLVHVPVIVRGRRRSLSARTGGERAGRRMTRTWPPYGEQVRSGSGNK